MITAVENRRATHHIITAGHNLGWHKHGQFIVAIWDEDDKAGTLVRLYSEVQVKVARPQIGVEVGDRGFVEYIFDLHKQKVKNPTAFEHHVLSLLFGGMTIGGHLFALSEVTPLPDTDPDPVTLRLRLDRRLAA